MDGPTREEEMEKAVIVITSLIDKSEKAKTNLTKGHLTLIESRIRALKIALSLLQKEIRA